jgi:AraC-like DNA-binding protein
VSFTTYNEELLKAIGAQLDSEIQARKSASNVGEQVKHTLKRSLAGRRPSRQEVAQQLHLSVRTLQRRLSNAGITFQQLVEDTRRELARQYLKERTVELSEAAFLLGYEGTNSFFRAFHEWEGTSPGEWRTQHSMRGVEHKDPLLHLRMHGVAAKHGFRFDADQMPLNVMDAHFRSFEREVLPVLNREGIAPLGMKAFGHPYILHSNTVEPIEALHYCLNLPIAVQITGIDSQKILDQALEAVRTFKPFTQAQVASILKRTRSAALEGKYELYKTSTRFDGTQQHPEWLGADPLAD